MNGVRRKNVFQKWEVISSYICRLSFCSNLFKKGMNLEDIALFSGHSAARNLKIYIMLTPEKKVLYFLDYFKGGLGEMFVFYGFKQNGITNLYD